MIFDGEKGFVSTDTGESGVVFSDHYFDMNKNHRSGQLYPLYLDEAQVRKKAFDVITFNYGLKKEDL